MAKRKKSRKIFPFKAKFKGLFSVLEIFGFLFLFLALSSFFVFIYFAKDLPRPEKFQERQFTLPTKIYDREGGILLYQVYDEEKRTIIGLEQIPKHLQRAVISAEDANFYSHFGLDFKGVARAILVNLKLKKPLQGASTISQQLIRSAYLSREKTATRKIREIILTLELERKYSKEQILGWYLNQVPFGSNAYGVEAASQTFFNKSVGDLSLSESALLASLIRAPSYLSPYGPNKQELLARKNHVLDQMQKLGYISESEKKEAKEAEIVFSDIKQPIKAPHFVLYVKDRLDEEFGEEYLKTAGLKVFTTLDWELQQAAEKAVAEGAKANKSFDANNAALVALDPKTGEILAMVGSADYFATTSLPLECQEGINCKFEPKLNAAVYGIGRQPGSAFKPFAYAQAFIKGYSPETVLWDAPTQFNPDCPPDAPSSSTDPYGLNCYLPGNYDGKFRGKITMREALALSINVPSIKTLYLAGLKETIELAQRMGITTLNKPLSWYGLSLVLGGGEVRLLDLVSAYSVFANDGMGVKYSPILKIEDNQGNIIEKNRKTPRRILESEIARLINSVLSDNEARVPIFGRSSPLFIQDYDVAAKTGTTQDFRDGWIIGYSPAITAGVWVGNNDNSEMKKEPGVVLAGPIWNRFMREVLKKIPKENFPKPQKIENNPLTEEEILLPQNPQYQNWKAGVESWLKSNP